MNNDEFLNKAKRLAADDAGLTTEDVYVVWFCKTLGNWKALVSTDQFNDTYWEVTHNGAKKETYLDTYVKTRNVAISDEYFEQRAAAGDSENGPLDAGRTAKINVRCPVCNELLTYEHHGAEGWGVIPIGDIGCAEITIQDPSGAVTAHMNRHRTDGTWLAAYKAHADREAERWPALAAKTAEAIERKATS